MSGKSIKPKRKITRKAGTAVAVRVAAPLPPPTSMLEMISRAASDPTVDAEKVKILVELARQTRADDAKAAYISAMVEMKPKLPVIERNGKIVIHEKNQPKDDAHVIQSTPYPLWEDIDAAVTPILAEHGFALTFLCGKGAEGRITVTGVLSHRHGHEKETTMELPLDSSGSKNNVQAAGSSTSYGKRYTAGLLLNLRFKGQDDDGKTGGWDDKDASGGSNGSVTETQAEQLLYMLNRDGMSVPKFCTFFKVENVLQLPAKDYEKAIVLINTRSQELAKAKAGATP